MINDNQPPIEGEALESALTLALAPEEGEPFEFGGKSFTYQFLSVAAEQALFKLLLPRLREIDPEKTEMVTLYAMVADALPQAGAIILSDQDPECTEAWVLTRRGKAVSQQLFDLTVRQFQLSGLGKLFAAPLQIAGLLSVFAK